MAADTDSSDGSDFALSVMPASILVRQGGNATVTVNVTRQGAFDGAITITVAGLPSGLTAAPLAIPAGENSGSLVLTAAPTAAQGGPQSLMVTGTAGTLTRSTPLDATVAGAPGRPAVGNGRGRQNVTTAVIPGPPGPPSPS